MKRYVVSPKARVDLREILKHIARDKRSAAVRMRDTFAEHFRLLGAQPFIGERCEEYEHLVPGLRVFPVGNYLLYYTPTEYGVRIGHVAHGAMDQESLFRRWLVSGEF